MASTRRIFKLFSIGFLLSFARILGNNPVITESNFLALSRDMPNIDNVPIPDGKIDSFVPTPLISDEAGEIFTTSTETYLASLTSSELPLLFQPLFENKSFKNVFLMLHSAKIPAKELHGFGLIINHLIDTSTAPEEASVLLQFCHFIEAFHPSTDLGEQAKAILVREIAFRVPDLEKAILDYHVMGRNFKKAAKHLHGDVPESYRKTVGRLALKVERPEDLLPLTLIDLLVHAQIKSEPLPFTHPMFASTLKNITDDTDALLFELKMLFSPLDETAEMAKSASELLPPTRKHPGEFTIDDAEKIVTAQKNIPNNLVLQKNFKTIATLAAMGAEKQQDYKETVRQVILSYLPDGNFKDKAAYITLSAIIRTQYSQFSGSEIYLLLRFLIANIDDINKDSQPNILNAYEKIISDEKVMAGIPKEHSSLFLLYGKEEEDLIRKRYPEETANKIIENERTLAGKNATNYYLYGALVLLVGMGVWAHAGHDIAKRAKKRIETIRKKTQPSQPEVKTPVVVIEKEITLSDIILGTITDLLDKAPKDCPAIDAISEENSLPLKKTFTFPVDEHNGKTVDVCNPEGLIKKLIQFHAQQQEPFSKAGELLGVRKAEVFNVIKRKCRGLVSKHLMGAEKNTLQIRTQVKLTPKEKIERLLGNEKFPTDGRTPWVKLPTTTYSDLCDATEGHGDDPQIKTQMNLLENINKSLEEKKSQLNEFKKRYHLLSADYDATLNPSDADLAELYEKIAGLQTSCEPLLSGIADQAKQFDALVTSIEKRHDQLMKAEKPPQESKEEHDARVQRIRDEKRRKKAEAEAKAQAEIEKQARALEIDNKRQAERAAEKEDRQKNVLFARWEKSKDLKITTALLYASTALFILNDVMNAEKEDDDYLRDACILSGTQLYEALKDLSQTVFGELLPRTEDLAHYRNVFAHVAMFSNLEPNEWKVIASHTYHHFFVFIDAYHRVKSSGEAIHIKAMPPLHLLMPDNIDERNQFKSLCQRYLTLKQKLSAVLTDEKVRYHDRAIHFLSIAMRSLIMQIDDMGNKIGLTAKNKHMQLLAGARNQEAHNGVRTDAATLINLSEPINALMRTIKPANKAAKPSQVGLFNAEKKHPAPAPSPLPPKRPG